MDQASLNELLDELEHRTCVRFNSDPEMQEFINLVKELAPQRYFPHAGTWRLGTGTSSINGDAISCNSANHMISHVASSTYKRVIEYAELQRKCRHVVPNLGGLI